jgi:hypothetical protein
MDFFTVPTLRFQILYIFVILNHSRRQVVHFAVTAHPTMAWVIQQLREAMPFGQQPTYLFCDMTTMQSTETRWTGFLWELGLKKSKRPTAAPGKIHLWKGMEAPYVESCWIT